MAGFMGALRLGPAQVRSRHNKHCEPKMAGTMTARDVTNALRFYTGSVLYQRALTPGAGRLGLDGNLAGMVTPQEEAAALAKQRAWAARKAKAKPQVVAGPKRLTLADLKQAA
jgi:sRNA-binding protein